MKILLSELAGFEPHYLQHSSNKHYILSNKCYILSVILSQEKKCMILSFTIVPIHIYILGKSAWYFQNWISSLGILPDHDVLLAFIKVLHCTDSLPCHSGKILQYRGLSTIYKLKPARRSKKSKLSWLNKVWFCLKFTAAGNNVSRRMWVCSWCCLQLKECAPGVWSDGAEHKPTPAPAGFWLSLPYWSHQMPLLTRAQRFAQENLHGTLEK